MCAIGTFMLIPSVRLFHISSNFQVKKGSCVFCEDECFHHWSFPKKMSMKLCESLILAYEGQQEAIEAEAAWRAKLGNV